jgi:pimeloyl-ACP methyl ester carboxylesterase
MKMNYVDTHLGQLHYAEEGSGETIICLHQTPRSWDEFRELIPFLSKSHRVIAMDMYGFGQSAKFKSPQRIEDYASGVIALMDALKLNQSHILGHHTGALVAFESTAANKDRFKSLIISSMPFTNLEYREKHQDGEGVDDSEVSETGHHLTENWAKRSPFYPLNRPDILNRFTHDSLNFGVNPVEGHLACAKYCIEEKLAQITVPVLILGSSNDPFSFPVIQLIQNSLVNASQVDLHIVEGGMIPLMEIKAEEVSEAVLTFLREFK